MSSRVISSLATALLACQPVAAQAQQNSIETIQGVDLTKDALPMKPYWAGGLLRIRLRGLPPGSVEALRVSYGTAGELVLDAEQLAARTVSSTSTDVTLDLPIVSGQSIKLLNAPAGLKAAALEVIAPNLVKSEQRLDGSTVATLDKAASALARDNALGFGRLSVYTTSIQAPFDCTAFRVAKGYWMTAAHCGFRSSEEPSRPPFSIWKLQIQDWPGQLEVAAPLEARPVASGLRAQNPMPTNIIDSGDLDWMLLQVDADQGGPSFALLTKATAAAETPLELLQHSIGKVPPPAGKAVSAGDSCKVMPERAADGASNPELCLQSLRHGCSSQPGASGGPLLSRKDASLVAVHYRAGLSGLWNCGVPAAAVAHDLCTRFPSLASKVLKCPSN